MGAAWNTANVSKGSTVAIFGLGAIGLAVSKLVTEKYSGNKIFFYKYVFSSFFITYISFGNKINISL